MRGFALLATLALGCGFLAEAAPSHAPTPQVDEALGGGWSRVTHPAPTAAFGAPQVERAPRNSLRRQ